MPIKAINKIPKTLKALRNPIDEERKSMSGPTMAADNPKPNTVKPTASPRFSGNHFPEVTMGALYAIPRPIPVITP
jgi:hypothetical protein